MMEIDNKYFTITENEDLNNNSYNLGKNFFDERLGYCNDLDFFGSTGNLSANDLLNQETSNTYIKLN